MIKIFKINLECWLKCCLFLYVKAPRLRRKPLVHDSKKINGPRDLHRTAGGAASITQAFLFARIFFGPPVLSPSLSPEPYPLFLHFLFLLPSSPFHSLSWRAPSVRLPSAPATSIPWRAPSVLASTHGSCHSSLTVAIECGSDLAPSVHAPWSCNVVMMMAIRTCN